MLQTISIVVDGLVQGVFYRQSTKAKAIELGINGEIKNKPDGTVHIIATGTEAQLSQLIEWCNKGPEMAIVTKVKVENIPLQAFKGFSIVKN
ncbi:MAG: acylphosphatase [Chitinophagaceae bacterium]